MNESFPSPTKGNGENNIKVTPQTEPLVTVTNTIVESLRAEPKTIFSVSDIFHCTRSTRQAVKMALSRLSSPNSSAPVKRVGRGLYQYDLTKETPGLTSLVQLANWKAENVVLVTKGAYPPTLLPLQEPGISPEMEKGNKQQPTSKAGYPWHLPTGQCVSWERYDNGTQIIRLSAKGAPPFSPDHVLTLLEILKKDGLDDTWDCVSIEVNIDSRTLRVDASINLQVLEGLLLKVYQHGPCIRVELADRRRCSLGEVMGLLTGLAGAVDAREALQRCNQFGKDLKEVAGTARLGLNNSRKVREKVDDLKKPATNTSVKSPAPIFRTGAEVYKERVAVGAEKQEVKDHE